MRQTRLRWFCHIQKRPIDVTLRKSNSLEIVGTSSGRGRLKKTQIKAVRNDLKAVNLIDKIALNQTEQKRKIHVAEPG